MSLSKQLKRFLQLQGMSVVEAATDGMQLLKIELVAGEGADLVIQQRGSEFFLHQNLSLESEVWEELPFWMPNESALREMLAFLVSELTLDLCA